MIRANSSHSREHRCNSSVFNNPLPDMMFNQTIVSFNSLRTTPSLWMKSFRLSAPLASP